MDYRNNWLSKGKKITIILNKKIDVLRHFFVRIQGGFIWLVYSSFFLVFDV
jgi:hypothetical protein